MRKNFCSFSSHKNIPKRNRPIFFHLSLCPGSSQNRANFLCSSCKVAEPRPTRACLGFYSVRIHVIGGEWKQETVSFGRKDMALGGTEA